MNFNFIKALNLYQLDWFISTHRQFDLQLITGVTRNALFVQEASQLSFN